MAKKPVSFALLPAPPLFWQLGLLALVAGIAASVNPVPACLAWGLGVWASARARGARLLFLFVCLAGGFALGWHVRPVPPAPAPDWIGHKTLLEGTVVSSRDLPDNRVRIILEQVRPVMKAEAPLAAVQLTDAVALTWHHPSSPILPGQRLTARVKVNPVRGFLNEHGPDFRAYWYRQNVGYTAYAYGSKAQVALEGAGSTSARIRSLWRMQLDAALQRIGVIHGAGNREGGNTPGAGILPALLFADQKQLTTAELERVTKAGLRHSLALSGQHLAVVGLMALLPAFLLVRLAPSLLFTLSRRTLVVALSVPFAALCLWLGNAPLSLVRAGLMLLIWLIVLWRARPATVLDVLFIALACMVAANPLCIFELGVQLSFLAVAGIGVAHPLWKHAMQHRHLFKKTDPWWKRACLRCIRGVVWALCLSLAAQAASLPLVLDAFGRVTPGLFFNVLWLPVLGCIVLPAAWLGLLLQMAGLELFADIALRAALFPCALLTTGLASLEGHGLLSSSVALRPHWLAALGYGAFLVGLVAHYSSGPQKAASRLLLSGLLLVTLGPGLRLASAAQQELGVHLVDVGQGQAVIIEWPGGRGLIDAGGFASSRLDSGRDILTPILTANKAPRLDFVAVSHMDRDHAGGIFFLLEQFAVPLFLSAENAEESKDDHTRLNDLLVKQAIPRRNMVAGDQLVLSSEKGALIRLEALWPPAGHRLLGNDSLVLRLVRNNDGLALFMGDSEPQNQQALLARFPDKAVHAKILILPHHGSRLNLEPDLYDRVKPDVALASTGANNPWGFPAAEVCEALKNRLIPLYTTARNGGIRMYFSNPTLQMQPSRSRGLPLLSEYYIFVEE